LAALAVMAFHYTSKYDELFHFQGDLPFAFKWGYLGVNLFFVISGFVIFMTLERTRAPLDFVVSRASRLFPAYWTAIVITFLVTHLLGLPGKQVSWTVALLNFSMIHELFSIPSVDNVYWTLVVELLFYGMAFALFVARSMHRVLFWIVGLLCLRMVYWAFAEFAGIDLPWRISKLLVLEFMPWFALGIVAFRVTQDGIAHRFGNLVTAMLAIAVLGIAETMLVAAVGAACFIAIRAAASGRMPLLRNPALVWLGGISYPLYLLHENVGWAVIRQLQMRGWTPVQAIMLTTLLVIGLAAAVSYGIERPGMAWIRGKYRNSRTYQLGHAPR
jgi:peptidoglycan/LPS O-acetylase OafA/YrhL